METEHEKVQAATAAAASTVQKAQQLQQQQKGHCRSSSLENGNSIFPAPKSAMLPSGISAGFSGTLKSRREQKRISDYLSRTQPPVVQDAHTRRQHFENIREVFEKTREKLQGGEVSRSRLELNQIIPTRDTDEVDAGGAPDMVPPKIQPCSGVLGKGRQEQVIRPIAFKPVPYRPSHSHSHSSSSGRLTNELSERYGSTPSLVPPVGSHHKFGSANDLNYHNYGLLYRKHYTSSIPFKTYDSLESILRLPDSVTPTQAMRYATMPCARAHLNRSLTCFFFCF